MSNMQIPEKEKFKQKLSNELPAPPSSRESYRMRTVNYSTVPAPMCTALTDIRKTTVSLRTTTTPSYAYVIS